MTTLVHFWDGDEWKDGRTVLTTAREQQSWVTVWCRLPSGKLLGTWAYYYDDGSFKRVARKVRGEERLNDADRFFVLGNAVIRWGFVPEDQRSGIMEALQLERLPPVFECEVVTITTGEDNDQFAVFRMGPGTLVVLHGVGAHGDDYAWLSDHFRDAGFGDLSWCHEVGIGYFSDSPEDPVQQWGKDAIDDGWSSPTRVVPEDVREHILPHLVAINEERIAEEDDGVSTCGDICREFSIP